MDRGLDPRQFVDLFLKAERDLQVETAFVREFGQRHPRPRGGVRDEQCCTCRKGECLDPVNTEEGREKERGPILKGSPCLFQQYKMQARISVGIQSLRDVDPQRTRTAALSSAAPGLKQPTSSGGEGPIAPCLLSQL